MTSTMEIEFCGADSEDAEIIHVDEIERRLRSRFPDATFDKAKGDEHIEAQLQELIQQRAPEVILASHRNYFGGVAFVSVASKDWGGASASGYVFSISPPLGDHLVLQLKGVADRLIGDRIAHELGAVFGLEVFRGGSDTP
jgi:hypothetical protein